MLSRCPMLKWKSSSKRDALGNTRQYPMVISFSEGDPLDEEVRDAIPRPPLPEVNQIRGRIGFDVSTIQQLGQAAHDLEAIRDGLPRRLHAHLRHPLESERLLARRAADQLTARPKARFRT